MRAIKYETLLWVIFIVALMIYALLDARAIPGSGVSTTRWPLLLLVLLSLVVLGNFFESLPKKTNSGQASRVSLIDSDSVDQDDTERDKKEILPDFQWCRIIGLFIAVFAYIITLPKLGFFIVTCPFIILMMYVFGERRYTRIIPTAVLFFLFISVTFTTLLYVPLPTGNIEPFYQININIVEMFRALRGGQ